MFRWDAVCCLLAYLILWTFDRQDFQEITKRRVFGLACVIFILILIAYMFFYTFVFGVRA
jgi:hypothetical protein